MKNLIFILFCLPLFIFGGNNDELNLLVKKATDAYDAANYTEALTLSNQLINEGYHNSSVYFNAGNTNFQLHDYAQAIWCYEKALKLKGNKEKIETNLELARERIADKHAETRSDLFEWISSFIGYDSDFWAIISLFLFTLFVLGWLAAKWFKNSSLASLMSGIKLIGIVGFFTTVIISEIKLNRETSASYGIIVSQASTVKQEPAYASKSVFVVNSGSKVYLIDNEEGWTNIRFGSSEGWIKTEDVKGI